MSLNTGAIDFSLVRVTDRGLYCQVGDFYIDPWRPVERALTTHGHFDHALLVPAVEGNNEEIH